MAMLFITHDLGVVAELCNDVLVMYAGRVAEHAPVDELFAAPRHPYTRGLIAFDAAARHVAKSVLPAIEGVVPALKDLPPGCRFSNRCALRRATSAARRAAARAVRARARRRVPPVAGAAAMTRAAARSPQPTQVFPGARRRVAAQGRRRARRRRRVVHAGARPDAGPRRRVGLRQDDGRPNDAEPAAEQRRQGAVRRPRLGGAQRAEWRAHAPRRCRSCFRTRWSR